MRILFMLRLRFTVQGSRFKVQGSRFKVQGSRRRHRNNEFPSQEGLGVGCMGLAGLAYSY
jgi:hypothetical protein